ncbi:hypothetical protein RYX56_05530 [Alkalihalophilus lindianensis]|uniref:DUF6906 domain-containing protein n=1 Tax=Alkalihalophilus lindianensis TaxID=1630542 RepID=A0ABU3X7B9_9BACI|nr:hypothetical protein [Alkalihalophilus lindianensis]MDV2683769.1 hypothetical protein [Alkalihalophilus lindianensis]MDV2683835.1 hypothetical protein [Alkalihalophilus lindianensis]
MKQGKNPNRRQKESIKQSGLNPNNWLVSKANDDQLLLIHRETGTSKLIYS